MARDTLGTGADFDGAHAKIAYNLARCPVDSPDRWKAECFTVFERDDKGRVSGYVDDVLIEDVTFVVSRPGVERIRKHKKRKVVAWARGVIRDPDKPSVKRRLGDFDDWVGIGFNPYKGFDFVNTDSPNFTPVHHAEFVFFDSESGRGIAKLKRGNPGRVGSQTLDEGWLLGLIDDRGGDITGMGGAG